jgi:uncharacterized protein
MPTVVADSSVIIHLAAIGRLDLLQKLHGQILIPPMVWKEVVEDGRGRVGEAQLRTALNENWIAIETPENKFISAETFPFLHPGEIEAIQLAMSHENTLLIMDEAAGREAAIHLGIKVIGIVGVLVSAKQKKLIPDLARELQELRGPGRFRISNTLIEQALKLGGE